MAFGAAARHSLAMRSAAALALATLALAACDNRNEARVGGAVLPQAFGTSPLPSGSRAVAVKPGAAPAAVAAGDAFAFDVNVPWSEARALIAAHPEAPLVVGDRSALRGFALQDPGAAGPAVKIVATARGKFCLSPPGTDLAYCMESSDRRHISAAFVREAMRKAVAEYGITQARVDPEEDVLWADLVRTIDGARTCCKVPVLVRLVLPDGVDLR